MLAGILGATATYFYPSPYASSFAGFVEFKTAMWFGGGGLLSTVWNGLAMRSRTHAPGEGGELPEDMSTTSLVGGGLIAGDSIAALILGVIGRLALVR